MSTSKVQALQHAHALVTRARAEEHEDGDALLAARCYTTAVELLLSWAVAHAATLTAGAQRRYFLFQVRTRAEVYYERAALLLRVAVESGALDKPSDVYTAIATEVATQRMRAQEAAEDEQQQQQQRKQQQQQGRQLASAASCDTTAASAVLGIPLQPPPPATSANVPPSVYGTESTVRPYLHASHDHASDDGGNALTAAQQQQQQQQANTMPRGDAADDTTNNVDAFLRSLDK